MLKIGFKPQVKNTQQNNRMNFKGDRNFYLPDSLNKEKEDQTWSDIKNYVLDRADKDGESEGKTEVWYYKIFNGISEYVRVLDGPSCNKKKISEDLMTQGLNDVTTLYKVNIEKKLINSKDCED